MHGSAAALGRSRVAGARRTERRLLILVGLCLLLGIGALTRALPDLPVDAWLIAGVFIVAVAAAHIALTVLLPAADELLLPLAAMLSAMGLVFVLRLSPRDGEKQ